MYHEQASEMCLKFPPLRTSLSLEVKAHKASNYHALLCFWFVGVNLISLERKHYQNLGPVKRVLEVKTFNIYHVFLVKQQNGETQISDLWVERCLSILFNLCNYFTLSKLRA